MNAPGWSGGCRLAAVMLAVVAAAACSDGHSPLDQVRDPRIEAPIDQASTPSVTVAPHLHAWSNHSGSSRPASMAWHIQQNALAGVDVIWFSDHADIFPRRPLEFLVTPETPSPLEPGTWRAGRWGPGGSAGAFVRWIGPLPVQVSGAAAGMRVQVPGRFPAGADTLEMFFGVLAEGRIRRASYGALARPLAGNPRVRLTVRGLAGSRPPVLEVRIPLAWQPNGADGYRPTLIYRFGEPASLAQWGSDSVLRTEPWPEGTDSAMVSLTPLAEAWLLGDGVDNTMDEVRLRLAIPRASATRSYGMTFPYIIGLDSTAARMLPLGASLAHTIAARYGVRSIWGIEAAPATAAVVASPWGPVAGAGRHLSVYLPGDLPAAYMDSLPATATALTSRVRASGGVTSITHPFGTPAGRPLGTPESNRGAVEQLGEFLASNRAWGAELLEVGYVSRGGMGTREHLMLYDYLSSRGIRVCGVGSTDSHGGRLVADPEPYGEEQWNFVSWLSGVDRDAPGSALVAAFRDCRVSFGSPFYVRGGLWLSRDTAGGDPARLALDARGVSPSAEFRLYEIVVDSTPRVGPPVYNHEGTPMDGTAASITGGCRTVVVRVEAWAAGRPIAFSNPVTVPGGSVGCTTN